MVVVVTGMLPSLERAAPQEKKIFKKWSVKNGEPKSASGHRGGDTGGGANTVLFGKNAFPLLYRVFSLRRQKTWSLAGMKTGIFQRFWMSPNNNKN